MTKYNGATWGSCCIQATNLLYQKNSQTAIDANDAGITSMMMKRRTEKLPAVGDSQLV